MGAPKDLGVDPFPDPISHFWIRWMVRCCRRCVVAGGEHVPPRGVVRLVFEHNLHVIVVLVNPSKSKVKSHS